MRITYAWLLLRCDPPRLDEAEVLLMRAHDVLDDLSFGPHLAACETEMARCALLRGDYGEAVRMADLAIARCADNGAAELEDARVVSGLALIMSGHTEKGAATVSAAASRLADRGSRTDAAQAWRELAEALIQRDRSDQAIAALRRAADCAGARSSSIRAEAALLPVGD
jgi:tetratricopeptide (TPR) repeat protein